MGAGLLKLSNQSQRKRSDIPQKLSHAAEQFNESLKRMDLITGLELAIQSEEDIIQESMQMQLNNLDFREYTMKENDFFKKYSAQYSNKVY